MSECGLCVKKNCTGIRVRNFAPSNGNCTVHTIHQSQKHKFNFAIFLSLSLPLPPFQFYLFIYFLYIFRRYGTKCSGCGLGIAPSELVRKPQDKVFHLNCFSCYSCKRQLSTGDHLYVVGDNKFLCKDDYFQSKHLSLTGERQTTIRILSN